MRRVTSQDISTEINRGSALLSELEGLIAALAPLLALREGANADENRRLLAQARPGLEKYRGVLRRAPMELTVLNGIGMSTQQRDRAMTRIYQDLLNLQRAINPEISALRGVRVLMENEAPAEQNAEEPDDEPGAEGNQSPRLPGPGF